MEIINNINKTLRDDLSVEIKQDSKLSIAAACFSIYAFQELKAELKDIDELRFIFTAPTFITEKSKKRKREFYIPWLNRECGLYITEFEFKFRHELVQKAIAFNEGSVKHIYFVAETKGTMESLNLRPIEQAKISCAKKLFNEISTSKVKYHDVDSYQSLLNIMSNL